MAVKSAYKNFSSSTLLNPSKSQDTTSLVLHLLAKMDELTDADSWAGLVIVRYSQQLRIDDQRYSMGDFLIKIDHPNDDFFYGRSAAGWQMLVARLCSYQLFCLRKSLSKMTISSNFYAGIVRYRALPLSSNYCTHIWGSWKTRQYAFNFSELSKNDSSRIKLPNCKVMFMIIRNWWEWCCARYPISAVIERNQLTDADTSAICSCTWRIEMSRWAIFVEQPDSAIIVCECAVSLPNQWNCQQHTEVATTASGANAYSEDEVDFNYQKLKESKK